MQFLAPTMLFGGLAVGVPVALHFFFKARYKPLPWAAMKFLKEAIEQTSRRLKFQEWILLALRCLVILLLALAIARPGSTTTGASGRGDAIDAVLVFDVSFSMGAADGTIDDPADRRPRPANRLDRAKEAALGVLNTLPANSSVQVFACADRATLLGPVSRYNLDQARELVKGIDLTSLSTDFLPGLTEALDAAASGTAPAKEIYVFSDLQKSGFERQQGAIKAKCEEIRTRASLVFVRCGGGDRKVPNVAVTDVSLIGDIPHTKTRVPFVITLKNTGSEPVRGVDVGLELEGRAIDDVVKIDLIEPGQAVPVTLTGTLDEAGPRVLTVRLTGDALPGDNRFDKVILIRDVVRVLVVDGSPNPDTPTEAGAHFVRNALTPVPETRTEEYYIRPQVVTAAEADPQAVADKDVVYLLNAPVPADEFAAGGLSAAFVNRLAEFARNGGGVVVGCGDQVDPDGYNKRLGSGGAGLLPFDLVSVESTGDLYPFAPAPESVEVPSFLAPFRESPFNAALRGVGVTKMFKVNETGRGSTGGRVLVRTADLKPLVASRVVGEGEVVLVTTSLDEKWGKFPSRSEAFVPFTRFALAHLTGRRVPGGNRTAGDPLVYHPPALGFGFDLVKPVKPGDKPPAPRAKIGPAQTPAAGQKLTVTATDTFTAGVYRIVPAGEAESKGPVFAVNADLRESANLDPATEANLKDMLGFAPKVIPAGAGTEGAVTSHRSGREWTEWVLLAVLAFLAAESVWAWVCGKAW
jgi:hypothetical protein